MRTPIFLTPKRADIAGILFGVALIGFVAVFFAWQGQKFHSVPGTDLMCSDSAKTKYVGPVCIHKVPAKPAL